MSKHSQEYRRFAYERSLGYRAAEARERALGRGVRSVEAIDSAIKYESEPRHWFKRGPQHGAADESGLRWIENAAQIMRRVGYADEVCKAEGSRRVDHFGWYSDDDGIGEGYAGVVYQVTGRNGKPRFLAGYEATETNRQHKRENPTQGARLDCSHLYDSKLEAASAGDHIAERAAESERDYRAAESAGIYCAEMLADIARERQHALAVAAERRELMREMPQSVAAYPATCEALGAVIREARAKCERIRAHIRKAAEESRWRNREAFDESAGPSVLAII